MSDPSIRPLAQDEASDCEGIMRSLPEWFGIEESIVQYAKDLESMETFVAEVSGRAVGFVTVNRHNDSSAEIHVMAVEKDHHGERIGRRLVEHAEAVLVSRGCEFLEVKTLGPSRPNVDYEKTRGFYLHLGFRPLEENNLWGDVNPCLIMVKHLQCGSRE